MNKEQFESVTKWQNETFKASTAMSKIAHLGQEYVELVVAVKMKDPQRRLEFADAFILLYGAAAADGMTYEDICKAIDEKMEINRKRQWGLPDKDGVVNHIREDDRQYKCEDIEFQPGECETYKACKKCPHYKRITNK